MEGAKISIIIPAFNAGKTLGATLESVRSQTLKELEIWVVDDGSTDETGRIADAVAACDARVHVVHQENQGTFRARLNALKRIKAPYFGFVDADDHIEPKMYERMLEFAEGNDLDVVQSDLWGMVSPQSPEFYLDRETVLREVVRPWLFEGKGMALVWDKIYRKSCKEVSFNVSYYSTYEDLIFNLHFFQNVSRFGRLHEGYYHYQPTDQSTTRNYNEKNVFGFAETIRVRKIMAESYGFKHKDYILEKWIVENLCNQLRLASTAPGSTFAARLKNVKNALAIPAVRVSVAVGASSSASRYVMNFIRTPTWAIIITRFKVWALNRWLVFKGMKR